MTRNTKIHERGCGRELDRPKLYSFPEESCGKVFNFLSSSLPLVFPVLLVPPSSKESIKVTDNKASFFSSLNTSSDSDPFFFAESLGTKRVFMPLSLSYFLMLLLYKGINCVPGSKERKGK